MGAYGVSDDILKALKMELRTIFPGVNLYSRPNAQGIATPFIQLRIPSSTQERMIGHRWWYRMRISAAYVMDSPTHEQLQEIRERLLFDMDEVPFGQHILRAQNPEAEIVDDSVVFTAQYSLLVERDRPVEPYMETIEHPIYTENPPYEEAVEPIRHPDPGMWKWQENPNPFLSDEEFGLMEEIENDKGLIP